MPRKTVLLVDSHDDSRAIYTAILEHHGIGVLATPFLQEGVRMALEWRPDLVVLEVSPVRDGILDAVRILRAERAMARVPLVALSTVITPGVRERVLEAGFAAYLLKPCPPLELLGVTMSLLDGRR